MKDKDKKRGKKGKIGAAVIIYIVLY